MDFFEEFDNKEKNDKEKKDYIERFEKNKKIIRIAFTTVFLFLSILFLALGLTLQFLVPVILYIFLPLSGFYLLISIFAFVLINKLSAENSYNRFKNRIKNGRIAYNTPEMSLRIVYLENRVKALEEEMEELRRK